MLWARDAVKLLVFHQPRTRKSTFVIMYNFITEVQTNLADILHTLYVKSVGVQEQKQLCI